LCVATADGEEKKNRFEKIEWSQSHKLKETRGSPVQIPVRV
jgi:hypothetical protein